MENLKISGELKEGLSKLKQLGGLSKRSPGHDDWHNSRHRSIACSPQTASRASLGLRACLQGSRLRAMQPHPHLLPLAASRRRQHARVKAPHHEASCPPAVGGYVCGRHRHLGQTRPSQKSWREGLPPGLRGAFRGWGRGRTSLRCEVRSCQSAGRLGGGEVGRGR